MCWQSEHLFSSFILEKVVWSLGWLWHSGRSQWQPWTSDPLISTFRIVGFQMCTTVPGLMKGFKSISHYYSSQQQNQPMYPRSLKYVYIWVSCVAMTGDFRILNCVSWSHDRRLQILSCVSCVATIEYSRILKPFWPLFAVSPTSVLRQPLISLSPP